MRSLIGILKNHRWMMWCFVVGMTVMALAGMSRLTFEDNPRKLFESSRGDDPRFQQLQQLAETFGSGENDSAVMITADDVLAPQAIDVLHELQTKLTVIDGIGSVYSLLDIRSSRGIGRMIPKLVRPGMTAGQLERSRDRILHHPLVEGRLVSEDARMTVLIVRPQPESLSLEQIDAFVTRLRSVVEDLDLPNGMEATVTGMPFVRIAVVRDLQTEQIRITLLAILFSGIVAWILFRNVRDLIAVVAAPVLGMVWGLGLLGWIGGSLDVLNVVMAPLVLVVGFTDSVHLMFHIRRLNQVLSGPAAVVRSIRELGPACCQTSATTAVGFGSLAVVDANAIQTFGIACAAGAAFVLAAVLSIVPLVSWGRSGSPESNDARVPLQSMFDGMLSVIQGFAGRFGAVVSACGLVATAVLLSVSLKAVPDYRFSENLAANSPTIVNLQKFEQTLGGAFPIQVVAEWPQNLRVGDEETLDVVQKMEDLLHSQPYLSSPTSILTVLESLPGNGVEKKLQLIESLPAEQKAAFLDSTACQTVIASRVRDVGSHTLKPYLELLEKQLAELEHEHPGFRATLTGDSTLSVFRSQEMLRHLIVSLLTAALIIMAMLTIMFRSLRMALISLVPNALPIVATASLLVFLGQPLQFASVLALTITLGVVVDDSIHFLRHVQTQLQQGVDLRAAVLITQKELLPALLTTTLLLFIGFGVAAFSVMPMVKLFGILSCCSLLSALVADLVLLPAVLLTFGASEPSVSIDDCLQKLRGLVRRLVADLRPSLSQGSLRANR